MTPSPESPVFPGLADGSRLGREYRWLPSRLPLRRLAANFPAFFSLFSSFFRVFYGFFTGFLAGPVPLGPKKAVFALLTS
jgi:hypothetical protein